MTTQEFIDDLMGYYAGKYTPQLVAALSRFVDGIAPEDRRRAYQWTIEHRDRMTVCGVFDLRTQCRDAGISYQQTEFIPAEGWTCDACGHEFRYIPCASDSDRIERNLHDRCPNCGLVVADGKTARGYAALGIEVPWYQERVDLCRSRLAESGPFWSRAVAERERREEAHRIKARQVAILRPEEKSA